MTAWQIVVRSQDGRERIVALFVVEAQAEAECARLGGAGLCAAIVALSFDGCGCGG